MGVTFDLFLFHRIYEESLQPTNLAFQWSASGRCVVPTPGNKIALVIGLICRIEVFVFRDRLSEELIGTPSRMPANASAESGAAPQDWI
jgi:hypothetical protein